MSLPNIIKLYKLRDNSILFMQQNIPLHSFYVLVCCNIVQCIFMGCIIYLVNVPVVICIACV